MPKIFVPMANSPILDDVTWRRMARLWRPDGVVPSGGTINPAYDTAFNVFGDASGFNVKVNPGEAYLDGGYYADDAQRTLPINGPNATNPRIDLVVLRWDGPLSTADVIVLQGTPAVTPASPAVTQNRGGRWEEALGEVRVNVGVTNIAASAVTDRRRYANAERTSDTAALREDTQALPNPSGSGVLLQHLRKALGNMISLRTNLFRNIAGPGWPGTFFRMQHDVDNSLYNGFVDFGHTGDASGGFAALGTSASGRRVTASETGVAIAGPTTLTDKLLFDANFWTQLNGGNPYTLLDAADALQFVRSTNALEVVVGGVVVLRIDGNRGGKLTGPAMYDSGVVGVGPSSGSFAHGFTEQPRLIMGYWGTTVTPTSLMAYSPVTLSGQVRLNAADGTNITYSNDSGGSAYIRVLAWR